MILKFFYVYLFLRERERENEWGRGRERGRQNPKQVPGFKLQAPSSRLSAVSTEPNVGLELRNCEIMT